MTKFAQIFNLAADEKLLNVNEAPPSVRGSDVLSQWTSTPVATPSDKVSFADWANFEGKAGFVLSKYENFLFELLNIK